MKKTFEYIQSRARTITRNSNIVKESFKTILRYSIVQRKQHSDYSLHTLFTFVYKPNCIKHHPLKVLFKLSFRMASRNCYFIAFV